MAGRNQITGGAFQDAEGNPLSYGSITLQLSHDSQETLDPGQVVGGLPVTVDLDVNGNIAGTVLLWPNDQLNPTGSYYIVNAFRQDGALAWLSPYTFIISSSPSPFNIGTLVPINTATGGGGGGGSSLLLQTNGLNNGSQSVLNLVAGTNMTLVNTGTNVTFSSSGGGGGGAQDSVQNLSSSGTIGFAGQTNTFIKATAGVAGITLTLPTAVGVGGQRVRILMIDTGVGGITVATSSAQTINGAATLSITNQYETYTLESDNANWFIVASAG